MILNQRVQRVLLAILFALWFAHVAADGSNRDGEKGKMCKQAGTCANPDHVEVSTDEEASSGDDAPGHTYDRELCTGASTCRSCSENNLHLYHASRGEYSCAWSANERRCSAVPGWHAGKDCIAHATAAAKREAREISGDQLILVKIDSPHRVKLKDRGAALTSEVEFPPSDDGFKADRVKISSSRRHAVGHHHHGSGIPLELSSHPGLAIVKVPPTSNTNQSGSKLNLFQTGLIGDLAELGIGPREDAMNVTGYDGSLLRDASDGSVFSYTGTGTEGEWIMLAPGPEDEWQMRSFRDNPMYSFVVNGEGSISPSKHRHLAFGRAPHPKLMLVKRDSPNRLIFARAKDLSVGRGRLTKVRSNPEKKGVPLELSSHPGLGVVPLSGAISPEQLGPLSTSYAWLGVGPKEEAVVASYDGRLLARSDDGMVLQAHDQELVEGRPLRLNSVGNYMLARILVGTNDFVINAEGSISPRDAPNLALGCVIPGIADELVTEYQRQIAKSDAKMNVTIDDDIDFFPEEVIQALRMVGTMLFFIIIPLSKWVPWCVWLAMFVYFNFGLVQCGIFGVVWLWKRRRPRKKETPNPNGENNLLNAVAIPGEGEQGLREAREAENAPVMQ